MRRAVRRRRGAGGAVVGGHPPLHFRLPPVNAPYTKFSIKTSNSTSFLNFSWVKRLTLHDYEATNKAETQYNPRRENRCGHSQLRVWHGVA